MFPEIRLLGTYSGTFRAIKRFLMKVFQKKVQIATPNPKIRTTFLLLNWENYFSTKFFSHFFTYSGSHSRRIFPDEFFFWKKELQIWIFQLGTLRFFITLTLNKSFTYHKFTHFSPVFKYMALYLYEPTHFSPVVKYMVLFLYEPVLVSRIWYLFLRKYTY